MAQRPLDSAFRSLGLPPSPAWAQRLVAGLFGLYVVEILSGGALAGWLAWQPFGGGFQPWQPLTFWMIQGGGPALLGVMLGLLVLLLMSAYIDQQLGLRFTARALGVAAAAGTVFALIADAVGLGGGAVYGWSTFFVPLFCMFGLANPDAEVRLYFVLPVKGLWFVWGALLFAALQCLIAISGEGPGLPAFYGLGAWVGTWLWWHRGRAARPPPRKSQGPQLRVVGGRRDDDVWH